MQEIWTFVRGINPSDFFIWSVIFTFLFVFWRWHLGKNNKFNLMDLFCDDGKVSSGKFLRTGSWIIMSYGFYVVSNKSPELLVAYSALYGALWVSARAVDVYQKHSEKSERTEKKEDLCV